MRKTATLLLFASTLLATLSTSAQVYKFKTTSFSEKELVSGTKWSDWTTWEELSVLITIDHIEQRIKIYTEEIHSFDYIDSETPKAGSTNDLFIIYTCIDDYGDTCKIRLERLAARNNQIFISIIYDEYIIAYSVLPLK